MKLDKKKALAIRTLYVGRERIWFNPARLADIKEAITKQDIKDLVKDKAIRIKPVTGKLKKKKKRRRRAGKIKKTLNKRKEEYIKKIRKLRKYLKLLKGSGEISKEDYSKLRRYSKSGVFAGMKQLKEHVASMERQVMKSVKKVKKQKQGSAQENKKQKTRNDKQEKTKNKLLKKL